MYPQHSTVLRRGEPGDLWSVLLRPGFIDEQELWRALAAEAASEARLDYRSRLLIHEALSALAHHWGEELLARRLALIDSGQRLGRLWRDRFDQVGFASLPRRLVQSTSSQSIMQMLRELGQRLGQPVSIAIGGSCSLVLGDLIVRRTEAIDVVDEVPAAARQQPQLIDELAQRYALRLTHFASHYLPEGWPSRLRVLGRFGKLDARVVDPLDVLCGKLFSRRTKDLDDLRAAWGRIDPSALEERIRSSTGPLRSDPALAEAARHNWYILTGQEALPQV